MVGMVVLIDPQALHSGKLRYDLLQLSELAFSFGSDVSSQIHFYVLARDCKTFFF